jgi:hypothetical protein
MTMHEVADVAGRGGTRTPLRLQIEGRRGWGVGEAEQDNA